MQFFLVLIEMFGLQRQLKAMEDAHVAMPDFDPENGVSLFGVFDGHGGTGRCHMTFAVAQESKSISTER